MPGFSGAIGQFTLDPPLLSTNVVGVGDAVEIDGHLPECRDLKRILAPPPPGVTNWQIFPATASAVVRRAWAIGFVFHTMIPLTNSMTAPAIPFSYFDPQAKTYVDLTISGGAIKVVAGLATAAATMAQAMAQRRRR